jgi:D-3-phosphoglycerate dehydrogenase
MIGKVASAVGDAGINIDDMDVGTNASGEAALMVLALDQAVPSTVVDAILATPGVLDAKAIDLD